jgi:acetyl esterase/lipase
MHTMSILQATCEYKKVKRCSIKADIYMPRATHPAVILYIHGGALIAGSRRYLPDYQKRLYTRAGFAVASIDYRLAPETRIEHILEDVQDALLWLREEGARTFGWDVNRIAVMGGSAGGYLSLMTGAFASRPRVIVSFYGYGDILGDWYTKPSEFYRSQQPLITKEEALASVGKREKAAGGSKRYKFYLYCRQQGIWPEAVSGYNVIADRDRLLRFCPAYNVKPDYPPTLLLHGDHDTDVPYEQSLQMSAQLSQNGVENELITIPGGPHGFDSHTKDPVVKLALQRVVGFLEQHLQERS